MDRPLEVFLYNQHSSNLFRSMFQGDSRLNISWYNDLDETIIDSPSYDIFTTFLFDINGLVSNFNQNLYDKIEKNQKERHCIYVIDSLGEGADLGTRWGMLYKFCDLYNIHPGHMVVVPTVHGASSSHHKWLNDGFAIRECFNKKENDGILYIKPDSPVGKVIDEPWFNHEQIRVYNNDSLPFVYFGTNTFINKVGNMNNMAGSYNRLYDSEGLFMKMNEDVRDNKILSLTANPGLHRTIATCHLLHKEYQQEGLVSYNSEIPNFEPSELGIMKNVLGDSFDFFGPMKEKVPIKIDWESTDKAVEDNVRYAPNYDLFQNSYFSMIYETYYNWSGADEAHIHDVVFLTEKTLNALWSYHPFIIVNAPHSLRHLRKLGFQTFSHIIDESYDEIEDPQKRMKAVLKETDRIMNMSKQEIHDWYWSIHDIYEHNRLVVLDIVMNHTPKVYDGINKLIFGEFGVDR